MWNPFKDATQGAITGLGDAIKNAVSAFKADPTKVLELESAVLAASHQFESTVIASVNTTMQSESKSEHWMQWSWRPCFGFTACSILINNYVLLPYLTKYGAVPILVPMEVWLMVMAVLGVAAYTRGQEKVQALK